MSSRSAAHKPLRPFTVDHFRKWSSLLVLDNGEYWVPEDFQEEIVDEIFAGYREVLAVLPQGSYKTTTFGGVGLYHMQFTPDAAVPIGASSKRQAALMYRQASGFVRRSPSLRKRFKVQDGYQRIVGLVHGGLMEVYSAADDTGDGIIPSLAFIDELHRHRGHDLYGTWQGKLTKRDGQLVTATTAGDDENNPAEQLRDAARKLPDVKRRGRHTVARSAGREFVMHEYALLPEDDPDDLELVKLANPASQVTLEELRMRHDSPSTKRWQWLRLTCNRRSKGEESAIQPEVLDEMFEQGLEIPPGVRTTIGWDHAWDVDHAAIVPVGWLDEDERLVADAAIFAPPVAEDDVVLALLERCERYAVDGEIVVVYDPNASARHMVQQLERGTHRLQLQGDWSVQIRFAEHSQDNAPMALAAARFDEAVQGRWFRHDASPCSSEGCRCGGLRGQILNAVTKPLGGEKFKYDRPSDAKGEKRKRYPIDAFTGLLVANSNAVEDAEKPALDPDLYLPKVIG